MEEGEHCPGEYVSIIFTRDKKNGDIRIILNVKELNNHIKYMHFKMNSFDELVTPGCYMSSIDLKDAYFTVLIPPKDRKYLCFFWQGKVSVLLPAFWFISSTKNFLQDNETPNDSFETERP